MTVHAINSSRFENWPTNQGASKSTAYRPFDGVLIFWWFPVGVVRVSGEQSKPLIVIDLGMFRYYLRLWFWEMSCWSFHRINLPIFKNCLPILNRILNTFEHLYLRVKTVLLFGCIQLCDHFFYQFRLLSCKNSKIPIKKLSLKNGLIKILFLTFYVLYIFFRLIYCAMDELGVHWVNF